LSSSAVIDLQNVIKRYGDFVAVDDLSLTVGVGEVVGLLGPNGAGKTTSMRILTGFLPPTSGGVRVAGYDIFAEPQAARRAMGYLPETPPLYPEMSVQGYLRFAASIKDVPRSQRKLAADRALERCGLTEVRRRVIGNLSKGFRQRVGLAQAIVHDPSVLVFDEPTAGLDPIQIREIRRLIADLANPGGGEPRRSVILSTHILAEVEAICQRVILIDRGRKKVDQPMQELAAEGRSLESLFARVTARDEADDAPGSGGDAGGRGASADQEREA